MAYLFTSNEWVYYSAILLCMFVAIILYALQRGKTISDTDALLYDYGFKILGIPEE